MRLAQMLQFYQNGMAAALRAFLRGKDVFALLPVGFGKRLVSRQWRTEACHRVVMRG